MYKVDGRGIGQGCQTYHKDLTATTSQQIKLNEFKFTKNEI